MVSDFLTPGGRLRAPSHITDQELAKKGLRRNAAELLEYGSGNYWTGERMVRQTMDIAITIFELAYPPSHFKALFIFDNSSNHRIMADDALNVNKMNMGPGGKQPNMRRGWHSTPADVHELSDGLGRPKGIKRVLQERSLWPPAGLRLSCAAKEHNGNSCCARKVLASQPDFQAQVGLLREGIDKQGQGHIALFLPKFHPELNFIEYFWGATKRYARANCDYTLGGLRATVPKALESVPASTANKFFPRTLRITDAYNEGHVIGTAQYTV